MEAGGRAAIDGADVLEKADSRIKVNLGQRNGKIQTFLDAYRMDKIREITTEQEQLVRNVVTEGMAAGHPPAKIAIQLREHIGLTPYQASQVANYRADLEGVVQIVSLHEGPELPVADGKLIHWPLVGGHHSSRSLVAIGEATAAVKIPDFLCLRVQELSIVIDFVSKPISYNEEVFRRH
jgi:hypothetical protein